MSSTPMPWIIPQYFTDAGEMASFYQLFSYQTASTTKQDTFADSSLVTANSNPIVLDQYGRAPIFLSLNNYKFVLATPTASDPPAPADIVWTADFVPAYGTGFTNFDITGVAGETIDTDNNIVYLSDGSDSKTPGLWYLTNALNDFSSSHAIALGVAVAPIVTGDTGTIRIAGQATITVSTLTVGALYYLSDASDGRVTSTPPAQNVVVLGKADSTGTLIIEPAWGSAGATFAGLVGFGAQTWAGVKTFTSQPLTYIGAATTLPATIGNGGMFKDVTLHTVPAGSSPTPVTLSSTTIPADTLNADGKVFWIRLGSMSASTGANGWGFSIVIGGTAITLNSSSGVIPGWHSEIAAMRIDSDSLDVAVSSWISSLGVALNGQVVRINGLDFTAAIAVSSEGLAGVATTADQTYFTTGVRG